MLEFACDGAQDGAESDQAHWAVWATRRLTWPPFALVHLWLAAGMADGGMKWESRSSPACITLSFSFSPFRMIKSLVAQLSLSLSPHIGTELLFGAGLHKQMTS